jgi:hypothetical protein
MTCRQEYEGNVSGLFEGICLETLKKITTYLRKDIRQPDPDLNRVLPE